MSDLANQRLQKLNSLKKLKLDPYPQPDLENRDFCETIPQKLDKMVTVAGRLLLLRGHGRILFADLIDKTGKIQLFFEQNTLGSKMDLVKLFDLGDIISATGTVFQTQAGETTVRVSEFQILAKNLRPLPEKFHGLTDIEERYRQRYVDLIVNPTSRQVFLTRSQILTEMRHFLDDHGFLEVETPILQPVYGGASAKPFVTHHHELDQNMYLRISDELYLKRLIVGGIEKVYEVSRDFRNESVSRFHNPEFTQVEFYWAYVDYEVLMRFTEELVSHLVKTVKGSLKVTFQKQTIDFTPPYPRLTFRDAVLKYTKIDIDDINTESDFKKELDIRHLSLDISGLIGLGALFDVLYKEYVRPKIIGPVFIIDYPSEMIALAKRKADNPKKIASFQLLACGTELLKAYDELNDPRDQKDRWLQEEALAKRGLESAMPVDDDYIRALEYGMPPTAGWGMGIDRFTQFLTDSPTIKDVILFPSMKNEGSPHSKSIPISQKFSSDQNQIYIIDEEILQKFPSIKTGIAIIEGVKVNKSDPSLEKLKKEVEQKYKGFTLEDINNISPIEAYRNFFRSFGVDPASRHPSPDALLRRIIQGKGLYSINTLVDAYNVACLETNLGMSAMNLDKIKLPVTLRFTNEGEQILLLGGEETKTTKAGEVVYADSQEIVTLDLNYRDCDKTKITPSTKNVLLYVDGCPGISDSEIEKALNREIELIQKFCGGTLKLKEISTNVSLKQEIIIGQVLEIKDHPHAKKLKVVIVKLSNSDSRQIVCGADNYQVGDLVPVALPGTSVSTPEGGTQTISKIKLRGVESDGMLCSPFELGLSSDHTTIHILPQKGLKKLGQPISTIR